MRRGDWVRVKMSASKRIGWAFGNLLKFAGTMQTTSDTTALPEVLLVGPAFTTLVTPG